MPLSFDMPLEKLQTYTGSNPKPTDFDSFWDNKLKDISNIDPKIEIRPSKFQTSFAFALQQMLPARTVSCNWWKEMRNPSARAHRFQMPFQLVASPPQG